MVSNNAEKKYHNRSKKVNFKPHSEAILIWEKNLVGAAFSREKSWKDATDTVF
jgi:hypothetical protein